MYAVIKTGGKQYRVGPGDELTIERLAAEPGETVQFNDVLMIGGSGEPQIGAPRLDGAGVQAEIIDQIRGPKIYSFKKRRRKHSSKRLKGHRQDLTSIRVTEILASGASDSGVKPAIGQGIAARAAAPEASAIAPGEASGSATETA